MKARDIKNQISINHDHPGNANNNPMNEDMLNKDLAANIGDVLVAGPQENTVAEIVFSGNAYDLSIVIDNGQRIANNKLADLIKQGHISVKQ